MKSTMFIIFSLLTIFLSSCNIFEDESSAKSNPSEPASSSPLTLNKDCKVFKSDPALTEALKNGDLAQLKIALDNCASLDPKAYSYPDSVSSIFAIPDLFEHRNSDSLLIYLVENRGDSAARRFKMYDTYGLMA